MRSIVYSQPGPSSVLQLQDRDIPEPQAGEVRVRIVVSGVNPTDWKNRAGSANQVVDSVPNQDGSGVIDAVGEGVAGFSVGDRVWTSLAAYQRPTGGTAQEYTTIPAERVYPLPDEADFDLGASIGIPALTAHRALTVAEDGPARLNPGALDGRVVLVAGGAGAVGHAAIQLARWAGATVIATVSSAEKGELATSAGAHHVVNYKDADAAEQIRAISPDGVDQVVEVDMTGNQELNLAVVKPRATIAAYSASGPFTVDLNAAFTLNLGLHFGLLYTAGSDILAGGAEDVNAAIRDGALPIGEAAGLPILRFALEQTAAAHDAVESGAVGKVLIDVGSV